LGAVSGKQTCLEHANHDTMRWQRHQMGDEKVTGLAGRGHGFPR
jgi:hypothetical protein